MTNLRNRYLVLVNFLMFTLLSFITLLIVQTTSNVFSIDKVPNEGLFAYTWRFLGLMTPEGGRDREKIFANNS